jgi:hypothetical protein
MRTLGDYRDFCAAVYGPKSRAVQFFEEKIKHQGEDTEVVADESQMLVLINSMAEEVK